MPPALVVVETLRKARVLPVVVIDRAEDAVPLARALLDSGIATIEITLRTPAGLEAIRRIAAEVPGAGVRVARLHALLLGRLRGAGLALLRRGRRGTLRPCRRSRDQRRDAE